MILKYRYNFKDKNAPCNELSTGYGFIHETQLRVLLWSNNEKLFLQTKNSIFDPYKKLKCIVMINKIDFFSAVLDADHYGFAFAIRAGIAE